MNKRLIFSIIGVLILVGGLIAVIVLASRQQLFKQKAAPATSLTLVPTTTTPKIGDSFDVGINIDTASNQVAGTELYMSFDPAKLKANSVALGTFFVSPQVIGPTINNTNGTIFYSIYLPPGVVPKSGTGNLAVINFTALSDGSSQITFTNDSIVVAVGEGGQSVLQNKNGATINTGQVAEAKPTASPTGVPSATVTPTKSPSPTPTQSSNVAENVGGGSQLATSATAIPTLTPTPTPTNSPTPSPTGTATTTTTTTTTNTSTGGTSSTTASVSFSNFSSGKVFTTSMPTFSGISAPGAKITIVIHSDAQVTTTVTADNSGSWSFTPTTPLSDGSHTIAVTATDSSNNVASTSATFNVNTTKATTAPSPSLPSAGFPLPTILTILGAVGLLIMGVSLLL